MRALSFVSSSKWEWAERPFTSHFGVHPIFAFKTKKRAPAAWAMAIEKSVPWHRGLCRSCHRGATKSCKIIQNGHVGNNVDSNMWLKIGSFMNSKCRFKQKWDFNSDWELMMDSLGDSGIFPGFCLCFFLGPVAFASAGGPVEI